MQVKLVILTQVIEVERESPKEPADCGPCLVVGGSVAETLPRDRRRSRPCRVDRKLRSEVLYDLIYLLFPERTYILI